MKMYRPYMTEERRRAAQKRPVPTGCACKAPTAALARSSVRSVLSAARRLAFEALQTQRGPFGIMR